MEIDYGDIETTAIADVADGDIEDED